MMEIEMMTFRLYADGEVVHEDDFDAKDNSLPYYDDYGTYEVPVAIINYMMED